MTALASSSLIDPSLVNDIVSVVEFKLIRREDDVENAVAFKPKWSHLIFDDAKLYGYENLLIKIFYTSGSLKPYLSVTYTKKEDDATPEDIEATIISKFKCEFEKCLAKFKDEIKTESPFKPIGEKIVDFEIPRDPACGDSKNRQFEIYLASKDTPDFTEYHYRIETFTLWFIDGANLIDADDSLWKTFYMLERIEEGESTAYTFVGFGNVYEFYCYPDMIRPRISQVLILPPFNQMGLCAHLLKNIQMHYADNPRCRNITYEDPSEELTRVRWFVDASMCATLASFAPRRLTHRCDVQMTDEAGKKLKLNQNEVRTVFDILRLKSIGDEPSELNEFRQAIERRLCSGRRSVRAPFIQQPTEEEIAEAVQEEAADLIKDYKKVVERMMKHPLPL